MTTSWHDAPVVKWVANGLYGVKKQNTTAPVIRQMVFMTELFEQFTLFELKLAPDPVTLRWIVEHSDVIELETY